MAAILEVTGLRKHFGGVYVTQDVNFSMEEGEQSAIIVPNGAGKSTFMNLLTGYHRCDAGKVVFEGRDITNRPPHWIARAGISRAFQISSIFAKMTVAENVRSGVHAQMRRSLSIFGVASRIGTKETERVLELYVLEGKN